MSRPKNLGLGRKWWSAPHELRNGAAEEARTPDPLITNEVLYQLSYGGTLTNNTKLFQACR